MKALRLQPDCGLHGSDWRVVYGGSSISYLGPFAMLLLRFAIFTTHLAVMFVAKFYRSMFFFTTWTNLVALAFGFTSTLLSMAAVGSLSRERRALEGAGVQSSWCPLVSYFFDAEAQYKSLLSQRPNANSASHSTGSKLPPVRKCLSFTRPFRGSPRVIALESLLTANDIALMMALPMVTIMFIVYWTMLFSTRNDANLWIAVYMHLYSPLTSWLLAVLSRSPYRLSLFPLLILAGVAYMIMIAIFQSQGFGFVYWFLNFRDEPGLAIGVSVGLLLVCAPAVSILSWIALLRTTADVDPSQR